MTHPGMAFVFVVGVGLATILYYIFSDSNNHHSPHGSNGNANNGGSPPDLRNSWREDTAPSSRSKNRRKDSSGSIDKASCTICLMEIGAQHIVNISPCGHPFHKRCIQDWQKQVEMIGHSCCPICRTKIQSMR